VTIYRLCPKCGAKVDLATEGRRGPCRRCERERSRARRASGEPGVRVWSTARWQRTSAAVLARDGHRCAECGTGTGRLEVHHRQSLADGGAAYDLRNLVTLCPSCHRGQEGVSAAFLGGRPSQPSPGFRGTQAKHTGNR